MRLALRNPAATSLSLLVLSVLSTFLPILPGQYVIACILIAFISFSYYWVAAAWLWSAYQLAESTRSLGLAERIMFWSPPFVFAVIKYMQRYDAFSIVSGGIYSGFAKLIMASAFSLLLVCVVKVAVSIEARMNNGRASWVAIVSSALSLFFLPVGVWLVWPKLQKIDAMNDR